MQLPKLCPYCGVEMWSRRRVQCGAPDCARQNRNRQMREYMRRMNAEYRARGESFYGRWRTPEHYAALAALPKDPEKRRARRAENWQRRRAQKLAAPTESFRHVDVYERDGWVCGICTDPVDPALRYPDPMSASLDHVVPLSLGGSHTMDNVRLAHLRCNTVRQARIDAEEASA